eukprot:2031896-Pyramimonas_sp.AAC.1
MLTARTNHTTEGRICSARAPIARQKRGYEAPRVGPFICATPNRRPPDKSTNVHHTGRCSPPDVSVRQFTARAVELTPLTF